MTWSPRPPPLERAVTYRMPVFEAAARGLYRGEVSAHDLRYQADCTSNRNYWRLLLTRAVLLLPLSHGLFEDVSSSATSGGASATGFAENGVSEVSLVLDHA